MTHTPTPWKIKSLHKKMIITGNVHQICDGDNYPTAFVPAWDNPQAGEVDGTEEALANAAMIVHAVNSLPALVKALEDTRACFEVEYRDDRISSIGHASDGLRKAVGILDAALASHKTGG